MMLRKNSHPLVILAVMLLVGAPVWAKGVTVEIVVSTADASAPLSITDPEVLQQFSVWCGPRSRSRVRGGEWRTDYSSCYIDFPGGTVDAPTTRNQQFNIEFHVASTRGDEPWDETYQVQYALEPTGTGGYFYLPAGNPFIRHGVEGNWFRSSNSWEDSVRPLILDWLERVGKHTD